MTLGGTLGFIKLVGIAVSLMFGAVAAATDLRDERGALSFWGKMNVGGIILGGFLSISAQLMETSEKQDSALKSLNEIQRILHPLKQIRVNFRIEVDNTSTPAKRFLQSVKSVANSVKAAPCVQKQFCFPSPGNEIDNKGYYAKNRHRAIYVDDTSALFPSGDDYLTKDLTERVLKFIFFKSGGFVPDPASKDFTWLSNQKLPDLTLFMHAVLHQESNTVLRVDLRNFSIYQIGDDVSTSITSQTGDIASTLDLRGVNLVIQGYNVNYGKLDIRCIGLEIQRGRTVWISRSKMRDRSVRGAPLYFFTFPSKLTELNQKCLWW